MILRRPRLDLEGFSTWLETQSAGELSPMSRVVYRREARGFVDFAGRPGRKGWKRSQVETWMNSRVNRRTGKPLAANTKNRALGVVAKLAEYTKVANPTEGIPRSKLNPTLPKPIEGLDFILKRMYDAGQETLMWTCLFLVETGLRISEACGENGCGFVLVKDDGGEWALRVHGKGSKDRILPLSENGYAALMMLGPSGRLPFTVKQLQAATRPYKFNPHRLRHTMATRLYNSSGDIKLVSAALGHSSSATTDKYAQLDLGRIRAAMNGKGNGETK